MIPTLETTIHELYEHRYRPARHPGPSDKPTCVQYRVQINNYSRKWQFAEWQSLKTQASLRGKTDQQLYAEFHKALDPRRRNPYRPRWQAKISDLTDANVEAAMSFLVEVARENTTANKLRRHINAIWRYAESIGVLDSLPRNKKYRIEKREVIALFPDQIDMLLAAAARQPGYVGDVPANLWWTGLILCLLELGVRISAARKIPTANLDFERCEVLVPSFAQKQRKDQRLDLFPDTVGLIKSWGLAERGVKSLLGDWPFNTNTLRRYYKKLLVEAGLFPSVDAVPSDVLFHCLRKTLASTIFTKHGIQAAMERLGHSAASVTWAYIGKGYRHEPKVCDLIEPFPNPMATATDPPPTPPPTPKLRVYRAG